MEFWTDSVLVTCLLSWFTAQALKIFTAFKQKRKLDFRRFIGAGGMPSSHAAFVTSLAAAVAIENGIESTEFAMCAVFALVVMYDAAGVRRAAGQQARILNKIVDDWEETDICDSNKPLKELLGHTPKEVFVGALLGITIAIIRHF